MKALLWGILAAIILMGILLGIRFIFGGDEDTWICQNGAWVKHGQPSAAVPTERCE